MVAGDFGGSTTQRAVVGEESRGSGEGGGEEVYPSRVTRNARKYKVVCRACCRACRSACCSVVQRGTVDCSVLQ